MTVWKYVFAASMRTYSFFLAILKRCVCERIEKCRYPCRSLSTNVILKRSFSLFHTALWLFRSHFYVLSVHWIGAVQYRTKHTTGENPSHQFSVQAMNEWTIENDDEEEVEIERGHRTEYNWRPMQRKPKWMNESANDGIHGWEDGWTNKMKIHTQFTQDVIWNRIYLILNFSNRKMLTTQMHRIIFNGIFTDVFFFYSSLVALFIALTINVYTYIFISFSFL